MLLNEIKHLATEHIWLVPMYEDGQLGYAWCDDPAPGAGMDPEDAVEYLRKDVHDALIDQQSKSAIHGMNAAKSAAHAMREEARRTFAECSPQALESEREANAQLTDRVAELEQERDELAAHVERLNTILFDTFSAIEDGEYGSIPYDAYRDAYNDAPTTSLARRDLLKQAEAMELLYDQSSQYMVINRGALINRARNLRQQAENL